MVINMTLGRAGLGRSCAFACADGLEAAWAKAVHTAARAITTAKNVDERVDKKVERRPTMRLLRRRLLLGAPRLLVRLGRESLGGQRLGQRFVHDGLLRR